MMSRLEAGKFDAIRAHWEYSQRTSLAGQPAMSGQTFPGMKSKPSTFELQENDRSQPIRRFSLASPLKPLGTNPFVRRRQQTIDTLKDATIFKNGDAPGAPRQGLEASCFRRSEYYNDTTPAYESPTRPYPPRLPRSNTTSNLPVPRKSQEQGAYAMPSSHSSTMLSRVSTSRIPSVQRKPLPATRTPSISSDNRGNQLNPISVRKASTSAVTSLMRKASYRPPTPGAADMLRAAKPSRPSMPARLSSSHEITQHQLLQPLSPPLPKTPRNTTIEAVSAGKLKSVNASSGLCGQLGPSACGEAVTPTVLASRVTRQIYEAKPTAYWAGRLSSLVDKYLNSHPYPPYRSTFSSHSARSDQIDEEQERLLNVFSQMRYLCMSDEARESLRNFQTQYAVIHKLPALAPPKPLFRTLLAGPTATTDLQRNRNLSDASMASALKKSSFVDKLLGKKSKTATAS